MPIRRQKRDKHFSIVSNDILDDSRMSFKARGLLTYMLSKPDDWEFYTKELVTHSQKDGISSIQSALSEMELAGYLKRIKKRGEKGKFSSQDWLISDKPEFSPQTGFPHVDKPQLEKPHVDNPQLLSTDSTKTELTNNSINQELAAALSTHTDINTTGELLSDPPKDRCWLAPEQKQAIVNYFEQTCKFGMFAPAWYPDLDQDFKDWLELNPDSNEVANIFCYAFKQTAATRNVRQPFKYAQTILDRWEHDGLTKLSDIKASLTQEDQQINGKFVNKKTGKGYNYQPRRVVQKEELPEWAQPGAKNEDQKADPKIKAELARRMKELGWKNKYTEEAKDATGTSAVD